MHCKTCKHWKPHPYEPKNGNVCTRAGEADESSRVKLPIAGAVLINDGYHQDESTYLKTGPDFGCVAWEGK